MSSFEILDYIGVALFAATGALSASRKELDIVGFIFLASAAGIGGGTVRDLILGVPIFWIENSIHLWVCSGTALFIYFAAPFVESRYKVLLWLDAIALAAYSIFGAQKGMLLTGSETISIVMGVFTGVLGGIIRDILARERPILLKREIYVAASAAGACVFLGLQGLGFISVVSALAGFICVLIIRGGTIMFGWRLPAYRSLPGRDPEEIMK